MVVVLVLGAGFGALVLVRPDPLPGDASAVQFSATRAMAHVREIAAAPHPAGSAGMAHVAGYLEAELTRLGLEVRPLVMRDPATGVRLQVVAGRLDGASSTGAVLVIAHPDSVPQGPGAGDNATGAATLLETARALASGPRPRNDVIFLFDDGEELGAYQGGELFARHHPWMREVRLAVGLDTAAWGVPFLMQDSDDNGILIEGFADGVDHPVALGLDASTNRDSDGEIDPFRRRGIPGIELEDTYADVVQHTPRDTIDHVDPGSLQLMGDQTLGAVRAYAARDLHDVSAPDRSFFSLAGLPLVHYPAAWGWVICAGAAILVGLALALGRRTGIVGLRRTILGAAAAVGLVLAAMLLVKAAAWLYEQFFPDPRPHPLQEYLLGSSGPYAVVAAVTVMVLTASAYRWLAGRVGHVELGLGFLLTWLGLAAATTAAAPVGAYLFQWPTLVAGLAWLWLLTTNRTSLVFLAPSMIAVVLLTPQLLLSYFGGGVAVLPELAIAVLVIGLVAPALSQPRLPHHAQATP